MEATTMSDKQDSIQKLKELTARIPYSMLTTVDSDGHLRSHPMTAQQIDVDGCVWFFTGKYSGLSHSIGNGQAVNLSFSSADKNLYVSISGNAELIDNKQKEKELWSPILRAWFPKGLEDPDLVLLKVQIHCAEYWDTPSSKLVQLAGFAKAILTGKTYDVGEHKKMDLH